MTYRQLTGSGWAVALLLFLINVSVTQAQQESSQPKRLKIFILAGQSNMEGKGSVVVMNHQLTVPEKKARFAHLKDGDQWRKRNDVWIDYLGARGRRHGPLTVGYGTSQKESQDLIGPELGFGWTIGDHLDGPVLLIKTAWGGKSIDRDFRSPSRGIPDSAHEVVEKRLANSIKRIEQTKNKLAMLPTSSKTEEVKAKEKKKLENDLKRFEREQAEADLDQYKKGYGHFYRLMMEEIKTVTSDLDTYVPGYDEAAGYELAGFVWFQGWNDQYAPTSVADYKDNMVGFINDIRAELKARELPFVIGAMGHNGKNQKGKIKQIADAQVAVSKIAEFKGTVVTVETTKFWDTEAEDAYNKYWADAKTRDIEKWREFGNDRGYHYLGSPVFFYNAGVGFGKAMIELIEK